MSEDRLKELVEIMDRIDEADTRLIELYIELASESFEAKDEERYKYYLQRMRERGDEQYKLRVDTWEFKKHTDPWKELLKERH